jgi:FtsZ-binding cell division protein ZapB
MPKPPKNQDGKSKKATLEDKLRKAAGDATADALLECDADELQERLTLLAKHEKEVEDKRDATDEIKNLKEELKELTGPFQDQLKSIKLQRNFIASRLEEMGK